MIKKRFAEGFYSLFILYLGQSKKRVQNEIKNEIKIFYIKFYNYITI